MEIAWAGAVLWPLELYGQVPPPPVSPRRSLVSPCWSGWCVCSGVGTFFILRCSCSLFLLQYPLS